MPRPQKLTVEYFPHYTASKKTIFTLEGLYGNDGYAFWFKLLEILGSSEGHFYKFCKKADFLYLVSKTGVNEDTARTILETLVDLEAIDGELFQKNVIWCEKFIENLKPVYERRKGKVPEKPFIANGKVFNANGNPLDGIGKPQSRGSKVEEVKEVVYGEFQNVKLSPEEYAKLIDLFGKEEAEERIENLSEYVASKGKKYKSHYATIRSWKRREEKEAKTSKPLKATTVHQANQLSMESAAKFLNDEADNESGRGFSSKSNPVIEHKI